MSGRWAERRLRERASAKNRSAKRLRCRSNQSGAHICIDLFSMQTLQSMTCQNPVWLAILCVLYFFFLTSGRFFEAFRGEMSTNIEWVALGFSLTTLPGRWPQQNLWRTKALPPGNASRPPAELPRARRRRCCHRLNLDIDIDYSEPHVRAVLRVLLVEVVQPETPQSDVHRIDARPAEEMEAAHGRDRRRCES